MQTNELPINAAEIDNLESKTSETIKICLALCYSPNEKLGAAASNPVYKNRAVLLTEFAWSIKEKAANVQINLRICGFFSNSFQLTVSNCQL